MAFAAATSLIHNLKQLMLLSDQSSIPYPRSPIEPLYNKLCSFQSLLQQNSLKDSETQIRDAIYEAEDIIESHVFLPSQHGGSGEEEIFSQQLQKLLHELDSIKRRPETPADNLRQQSVFTRGAPMVERRKLVGFKKDLLQLKEKLIGEPLKLQVITVVGMAGIGKTTLVNEVYEDPSLRQIFHYRAWASVGPHGHVKLTDSLYKKLIGRRYLIVLDGLFDIDAWDDVEGTFPNDNNGSRILITTRLGNVALHYAVTGRNIHQMSFFDKDESWDLLHDTAFPGNSSCPPELLKIGKTVAENCQGLPLTIVLVGTLLSGAVRTPDYWKKVADNPISAIFDSNDDGLISEMQVLNDDDLPQYLRACFLYMGVFPLNCEIPASKLIKLWVSEGFLQQRDSASSEEVAAKFLEELADRNLVLVNKWYSTGGVKSCSIHSAVWHLCVGTAEKNEFFYDVRRYDYEEPSTNVSGRRICVRKNILFGIEYVSNTMSTITNARSLLCMGPEYPIPLPVCLDFRLLRVLDALTIRFNKFPEQIVKLVRLRYLALTCKRGELPASLVKLWNLQVLIVRRRLSIKFPGPRSYLPVEIWNLKYLRHLDVMGGDLPDPCGAVLPDLLTLSNASGRSCTKEVLEGTPNLKKLEICIEFADDADRPFDHLQLLSQLETFKCVIRRPILEANLVSLPHYGSNFPSTLKRIYLSGCLFPWEDIKVIARLPALQVLKLKCQAFQGPEWELDQDDFIGLKYLLLEDLDVKRWTADGQVLRGLERLVIRHCYNLLEIPDGVDYILTLEMLEVVECSPSVVASANRIKEMQQQLSNDDLRVRIDCSWNERTSKYRSS